MIYLIMNILVYLAVAAGVGGVAGWLWRNAQAGPRQDALERQLLEARGRLSAVEHALQSHEDRLRAMTWDLASRDETLTLRNREIEELERDCAELRLVDSDGRDQTLQDELQRTRATLGRERLRVVGLMREREAQQAALRALEQRLESAGTADA